MLVVLIGLGAVLLVLGAVVLFRHPDRPGGTIKLLGLEVTSSGAGLPLIALGVACIAFAATRPSSGPAAAGSDPVAVATPPVAQGSDCSATVFYDVPRDRVARIEAGMQSVHVIDTPQPLETPFGLILTANGQSVATLRIRLHRGSNSGADLYRIEAAVDGSCAPLRTLRNSSRGGDPNALMNWDTLRFDIAGREHDVRIGGEGIIAVSYTAAAR